MLAKPTPVCTIDAEMYDPIVTLNVAEKIDRSSKDKLFAYE